MAPQQLHSAGLAVRRALAGGARVAQEPAVYPWEAHIRGMVSHLALGVATGTNICMLDPIV